MARVLLADDDAAMRDLVCRSLIAEGHTVVVAHDGQEALDLAHSAAAPFDILVTDKAPERQSRAVKTQEYIARRTEIDYATYVRYRGKLQMK